MSSARAIAAALCLFTAGFASSALGQSPLGEQFTFQGRLQSAGEPANGLFELTFTLHDDDDSGSPVAPPVVLSDVSVVNGLFTVALDFGPGAFNGSRRWLQISVEGTPLSPRQELTAAPHAALSLNSDKLDSLDSTSFLFSAGPGLTLSGTVFSIPALGVTGGMLANGAVTGVKVADGHLVRSLNGLADHVTLAAGANVTITPTGNTLTIAASGGGVNHDATLSGDGTSTTPLGISIPLTLSGGTASPAALVSLTNTGSGAAIALENPTLGDHIEIAGPFAGLLAESPATGSQARLLDPAAAIHCRDGLTGNSVDLASSLAGVLTDVSDDPSVAVYARHLPTLNTGFLADDTYGVFGIHGISENQGYIGGLAHAIYGENPLDETHGFIGGMGAGVYGEHDLSLNTGELGTPLAGVRGIGVGAINVGVEGVGSGGYGWLGTEEFGAYGINSTSDNFGYFGGLNYAVYGRNAASENVGYLGGSIAAVYGEHGDGTTSGELGSLLAGVYGVGVGASEVGVRGIGTGGTGELGTEAYGVRGVHLLSLNWGVVGTASAGVYGEHEGSGNSGTLGASSAGVVGSAFGGAGVAGSSFGGTGVAGTGTLAGVSASNTVSGASATMAGTSAAVSASFSLAGTAGTLAGTTYGTYGSGTGSGKAGGLAQHLPTGNQVVLANENLGLEATGPTAVSGISNATNGVGVSGRALTGSTAYGVYGESTDGFAGLFTSKVHVGGDLTVAGTKSFLIDHPLDPANRFLRHACVESAERLNVYSGNVALDEDGRATVTLPDWFEAVNGDFRYQLTCIGGYAPVYVAHKLQAGRFEIAGGFAGLEVSWQVSAVRIDPYAAANPMPIEPEKPAELKGTYLYPELYGGTRDQQMYHRPEQAVQETMKQDAAD